MGQRSHLHSGLGPASNGVALGAGSMVSGERVLAALYTATGLLQARALSDNDLRSALAVAHATGELIAARAGYALRPRVAALAELPLDAATTAALGAKTGATPRQVDRGLELLLASQALLRVAGRAAVRLSRECLVDIPSGISAASLASVRDALVARRAAVMPALAVVRYLRDLPTDANGWIVSSLQQTAARTFFKRSTVARALMDLESVGAIERAHGPGLRGHYRIPLRDRDAVIANPASANDRGGAHSPGDDRDSCELAAAGQSAGPGVIAGSSIADVAAVLPRHVERSVADTGAPEPTDGSSESPVLASPTRPAPMSAILEVAGVAFPIPADVALQPEFDEEGRLWYRLGSARIGPITM